MERAIASTFEDALRVHEEWKGGHGTGYVLSTSGSGGYVDVTQLLAELRDAVLLRRAPRELKLSDKTDEFQARQQGWDDVPEGTVHLYGGRFMPWEGTRILVFQLPGPNPEDGSPFFGPHRGTHWVLGQSAQGYRVIRGMSAAVIRQNDGSNKAFFGATPQAAVAVGLLSLAAEYEKSARFNETRPNDPIRTDPRWYHVKAAIARGLHVGQKWPNVYGIPEEILKQYGR